MLHKNQADWLPFFLKLSFSILTAILTVFLLKSTAFKPEQKTLPEKLLVVQPVKRQKTFKILAATPQYADICRMIGGIHVQAEAIIQNPTADPHHFIVDYQDLQRFQDTDLFIVNGLNYDLQIERAIRSILQNAPIIDVSTLTHPNSPNPHLWFASKTYAKLALKICQQLKTALPEQSATFERNYQKLLLSQSVIDAKIAYIRKHYRNVSVLANEPILNLLLQEMNISLFDAKIQATCSHGQEPTGAAYIHLMQHLKNQRPTFFILNKQVDNALSKIIVAAAQKDAVPLLYVEEILPRHFTALTWLEKIIDDILFVLRTAATPV